MSNTWLKREGKKGGDIERLTCVDKERRPTVYAVCEGNLWEF